MGHGFTQNKGIIGVSPFKNLSKIYQSNPSITKYLLGEGSIIYYNPFLSAKGMV